MMSEPKELGMEDGSAILSSKQSRHIVLLLTAKASERYCIASKRAGVILSLFSGVMGLIKAASLRHYPLESSIDRLKSQRRSRHNNNLAIECAMPRLFLSPTTSLITQYQSSPSLCVSLEMGGLMGSKSNAVVYRCTWNGQMRFEPVEA